MCVHVYVLVCVAPPMVVGAWSMAGALQQLFEYYYYYYYREIMAKSPEGQYRVLDQKPIHLVFFLSRIEQAGLH